MSACSRCCRATFGTTRLSNHRRLKLRVVLARRLQGHKCVWHGALLRWTVRQVLRRRRVVRRAVVVRERVVVGAEDDVSAQPVVLLDDVALAGKEEDVVRVDDDDHVIGGH